jgi:putative PIN family toxin of toxin-antitoxin system
MKIVLDTNVLVSGLLQSRGNPAHVLSLVLSGAVRICHDERILAEYAEVLARPRFKFDTRKVRDVLNKLEVDGLSVDAAGLRDLGLPDADDEPFLAVALTAAVDFLVTGNLVDYPPDKCRGCKVVPPAVFIEHWRKMGHES